MEKTQEKTDCAKHTAQWQTKVLLNNAPIAENGTKRVRFANVSKQNSQNINPKNKKMN